MRPNSCIEALFSAKQIIGSVVLAAILASYPAQAADPEESDGPLILKLLGIDSDGDGYRDFIDDAFPRDPKEHRDKDGDGVGDNGDAFPDDPTETRDKDGDGVGDNADDYPYDPSRQTDTTPPIIILNGEPSLILAYAAAYREEGARAMDDVSGPISVEISGEVDTISAGTYVITYSAEDSAGNRSELTRNIEVLSQRVHLVISTVGSANYTLASGEPLDCATRSGECKVTLDAGTVATVTANPDPNHRFVRWVNCDTVLDNQCTVTVTDNRTVLSTVVSTEPIVFHPNVIELSADQVSSLIDYQSDHSTLEFAAGVDTTGIVVGNILLGSATNPDIIAFGRRILSLETTTSGSLLAYTETPTLPEIIRSGTILATAGFADSATASSVAASQSLKTVSLSSEPIITEPTHMHSDGRISLVANASYVLREDETSRIAVDAEVSISPRFEFIYRIEDDGGLLPRPEEWRLYAETDFGGSFRTSISGEVPGAFNQERQFSLAPAVTVSAISPVPILFDLQPVIEFALGLSVALEPGADATLERVVTGAHWTPQTGVQGLFDRGEADFEPVGIDSIRGDLTFSAQPGLQATARVLGLAGPFINSGFLGRATVSFQPFADCEAILSAYAAIRWEAGGTLDLLFYDSQFRLAEAEVALNFGTPEIPLLCSNPPDDGGDTDPPGRVDGIIVDAPNVSGQLAISWEEAEDASDIAQYSVWRFEADDFSPQPVLIQETAATTARDNNLASDTRYCYFVTAEDVLGNSSDVPPNENFVCATTAYDSSPGDLVSPSLLSAVPLAGLSIELTWSAGIDTELTSDYVVFDVTDRSVPRFLLTTSDISATVSGLVAGQNYCFAVAIRDGRIRSSDPSNIVCAVATDDPGGSVRRGWIPLADGDPGVPGDGTLIESQNIMCSPDCWSVTTFDDTPDYLLAGGADGFTVSSYFVDVDRPNRVSRYVPRFQFIDYGGTASCGYFLGEFNPRIISAPNENGVGGTTVVISRDYANEIAAELVAQRPACAGASADNLFVSTIPGDGTRRWLADGVYIGVGNDEFIPRTQGEWISLSEGDVGLPGDDLSSIGALVEGMRQFSVREVLPMGDGTGLTISLFSQEITTLDTNAVIVELGYEGFPGSCRIETSPLEFSETLAARTIRGSEARYRSLARDLYSLTTTLFSLEGPIECRDISIDRLYIAGFRVNGVEVPIDAVFIGIGQDSIPYYFDLP